jgi:GT2 family glycosyltransferase
MREIHFIAVNFNNADFTRKYIESIVHLNPSSFRVHVTIVDNASDTDDYEKLESACRKWDNVTLVRNPENLGYFRALNVGIVCVDRRRRETERLFFVVGNNDLVFQKDFLSELEKVQYDDSTLILAPNVVTLNGYHQNPHCRTRLSFMRKLGLKLYFLNYFLGTALYWLRKKLKTYNADNSKEYLAAQYIYMGIGACYVLTENFFKTNDKLDDRVFLYGEEALLANQVHSCGGKILYIPSIIVFHAESKTVNKYPSKKIYEISRKSYKVYAPYL